MYWNHRVIRRTESEYNTSHLYIVEVYYEDDDNSILGWTEQESVWGDEEYDGVEGLRKTLTWMLECLDKPILDEATLLAEAKANPLPLEQYEGPYLTFDELLDSLGLDREDVGIDEDEADHDDGFSVWDQD